MTAIVHHSPDYDVIIIGARCGGSPTAMLLARAGYRVLLVDRATFPSDTMRNHFLQQPAVERLCRWGLLPTVAATGCPAVRRITTDLGDFPLTMPVEAGDDFPAHYAPRRYILDTILVEAAAAAGAEVRQAFSVQEILMEDGRVVGIRGRARGGATVTERARIVVGADGLHSLVARTVGAAVYEARPTLSCAYYSYFADMPMDGAELTFRSNRISIIFPTNDDLTCVAIQAPATDFAAFRADIEGVFFASYVEMPEIGERVRAARRAERWLGTADMPNFFRKPYGPGWALVGDAGYHKDPILASGISDAFRDAELLADAIDAGFSDRTPLEDALAAYEQRRNEAAHPNFLEVLASVSFQPAPPEVFNQRAALRQAA